LKPAFGTEDNKTETDEIKKYKIAMHNTPAAQWLKT
jgi:hypothetical protein